MKKIILIISIVISLNALIFSSTEDDVFKLIKEQKYTQALKLIKDDNSFDVNKYPFIYYSNDVKLTKELLKKGAKVNEKVKRKKFIIKALNLKGDDQYYDNTPLFRVQDAKTLQLLIDNGANVNARGNYNTTPLMKVKNLEAFKIFIRNKADIHAKTNYGKTALNIIVNNDSANKQKHIEIAKMVYVLLMLGANPNNQDNGGHTPLHNIRWGHTDIAKMLVAKGAKIGMKTPQGNSALCYAIGDNKFELVKLYFIFGANFDWTCEKNMSLIQYAQRYYKITDMSKFLTKIEKAYKNK